MDNKNIICRCCGQSMYLTIDEWGRTPWHLCCDKCNIDVGTTNRKMFESLIDTISPNTRIEYYNSKIQFLSINNDILVKDGVNIYDYKN